MRPVPARSLAADDAAGFARVLAEGRPTVLRGLVAGWPALRHRDDPSALAAALSAADSGEPVDAVLMKPEQQGRLGYADDLADFNFLRRRLPLAAVIEQVQRYARFDVAPAVAVQSAPAPRCVPAFAAAHRLPALLHEAIVPRLWLGTAMVTPTHFDESTNLACVIAGRRRFTLFPPEQVRNLYPGPLDFAPTGTPISLACPLAPDLQRFPRFASALGAAWTAELEPGDALVVPPLWWHHVQSLDRFNAMLSHWWRGDPLAAPAPRASAGLDALWLAALALRDLPPAQRQGWQALMAHFVFGDTDAVEGHLPAARRGLLASDRHGDGALDEAAWRRRIAERLRGEDGG